MTETTTHTDYDEWGYPLNLKAGILCGNHGDGAEVYHRTVDLVRTCFHIAQEQDEQVLGDWRAERAAERHLEDRGYDEARAQDDYEARHGVIGFAEAYRMACPWLFTDELDEVAA